MIATYFSNKILDYLFGLTAYTPSSNLYLGVSSTAPNAGGTGVTEPVGNNYARCTMANNKTSFTDAAAGALSNEIEFTFNEATGNWGVMTHFVIYNLATGGNLLIYGQLTYSRTVEIATTLVLPIGDLLIELDNCV
jgi:hypothetical protein